MASATRCSSSQTSSGIIRAIEECFPRSARQRCLAHRMRNLAVKVPTDLWQEFKARATACYQAPSRPSLVNSPRAFGPIRHDAANRGHLLRRRLRGLHRPPAAPVTHRRSTRTTICSSACSSRSADVSRSSRTASAKSRCSSSCSAHLSVPRSAGAACASPNSNLVSRRRPKGPRRRIRSHPIRQIVPAPLFQQIRALTVCRHGRPVRADHDKVGGNTG